MARDLRGILLKRLGVRAAILVIIAFSVTLLLMHAYHRPISEAAIFIGVLLCLTLPRAFMWSAIRLVFEIIEEPEVEDFFSAEYSPKTNKKLTYIFMVGAAILAFSFYMMTKTHDAVWTYLLLGVTIVLFVQRGLILQFIAIRESSKQTTDSMQVKESSTNMSADTFIWRLVPIYLYLVGAVLVLCGGAMMTIYMQDATYSVIGVACGAVLFLLGRREAGILADSLKTAA